MRNAEDAERCSRSRASFPESFFEARAVGDACRAHGTVWERGGALQPARGTPSFFIFQLFPTDYFRLADHPNLTAW
jgi:hypothetical protein